MMLSGTDVAAFQADGFVTVDSLIDTELIDPLKERFERLFRGDFETGTAPDEVNWQEGTSDPTLARQICNGWKADRLIASVVLDVRLGEAVARLAGWPGARIAQDNVIWKPPGARSLGFHRDNAYLAWYTPTEMFSCWIALDDTTAAGGTMELARGSHRWPAGADVMGQFHAPDDFRAPVEAAAQSLGVELDIAAVEVGAGGGAFHHGWAWHGSGPNRSGRHRRSLVLHCASSEARFDRAGFGEGNGPIYSRYARLTDDEMDENHFPILWRSD
ncbi:MAG: phytanoyl-CoA dioxygenase family protein, partial [Acidimicrobiaceae bacterium]|nr:phytanoyl-CoA dioxygenase family protein [Acidimicrobiaceae bacterium]